MRRRYRRLCPKRLGRFPTKSPDPGKVFGKDFTKEEAVKYILADQHEHLGQSIAYARANGVVPPWSK